MIQHSYAPSDLRTVDPRKKPGEPSFDEWAARVAAVRVELRFGPGSEVAQMLGLAASPVETRYNASTHTHGVVFVCVRCGKERTRSRKSRTPMDGVCGWCRTQRRAAAV